MNPNPLPPDDQATTEARLFAGRYQVLDKLGEGGMGTVFRARDAKLDRFVALKMLPEGSAPDSDAVARFRREAKALARLTHPGIIQAYDSGEEGGRPFLVMELVDGRSLAAVLREQLRLSPARAVDFAYQAALALQHAHRHHLVHRDVKPSNLLLSADGRVRLVDLGLAGFLQDQIGEGSLTRQGTGMGTPDYCPPEQFRDAHKADERSDVYALGCTLYHLIAGSVPFPGSSFSEKVEAHETKEPEPLEERCPDVPAGVALTVRKMMAKRPAERFQTMGEVAEALMPHVAGSSAAFPQIRNSATWDGSRLVTMMGMPRRRIKRWPLVGAVAMLALVMLGVVGWARGWFGPAGSRVADKVETELTAFPDPKEELKNEQPRDPNVLTVAQKPGAADFQTIGDALEAVKPGQTVRVLDDAVYRETLTIKGPSQYAGVTLEAPRGATLERSGPGQVLLSVIGVPRVTVRGFRLRTRKSQRITLIFIGGPCTGLRLESLDLSSDGEPTNNGIELRSSEAVSEQEPIVIQGCTFRRLGLAASLTGVGRDTVTNVAVRDSLFADCYIGVKIIERAIRTQIVGNRFSGILLVGVHFELLSPDCENLLVANNSFVQCVAAFRVWDSSIKGKGVRLRNNLLLASESPDMYFLEADKADAFKVPGDGTAVAKAYDLGHNWREGREPRGELTGAWVKPDPKKGDVFKEKIDGVNRNPKSPDFLRPDPKSPLITDGAGKQDPSLPRYVGAMPPEGTEPWDWDRAWRMPKKAQLLTVSKEPNDGGTYRTIADALKEAKPWATVRVLDAETYEETIHLTDRKKHEGITIEAIKDATLQLRTAEQRLIAITDAPDVRITGFKLRTSGNGGDVGGPRTFVVVSGFVPGVALTRLTLIPKGLMFGIVLQNAVGTPGNPLRICHCTIRAAGAQCQDGIGVLGKLDKEPTSEIVLRSNRIFNCLRGINLHGTIRNTHVVGNLLVNCPASGIQLEDLSATSGGLLVANNTAFGGSGCFRVWDNAPYENPVADQVEITNNLFFAASLCDVDYVLVPGKGMTPSPGDGKVLLASWRFHHNCRDFSGSLGGAAIPAGRDDCKFKSNALLSTAASDSDRVRPGKDSPLATQGAGRTDQSLPAYIGALPCDGDPEWDWDRTCRARVKIVQAKR
jgi:hypothetical protein